MSYLVQQGAWEATQNKWKYGNEAGLVGAAIEDSAARLTQQIQQSNSRVAGAIDSLAAQIHSGLAGIEASLDHGFSEVLAAVGIMQESLEELVRLAANPAKTAAYEHFVEAREAFQNGWYQDCQEQLNKAMEGVEGVSSGYKMEWRFHYLKGLLYMGSNDNADHDAMADLPLAEKSFLAAAKYADKKSENRSKWNMSKSYVAASRVAEKMVGKENLRRALTHSQRAVVVNEYYGEGHFQNARLYSKAGEIDYALNSIVKAGKITPIYYAKTMVDPIFSGHKGAIEDELERVRINVVDNLSALAEAKLNKLEKTVFCFSWGQELKSHSAVTRWRQLQAKPDQLGLFEACGYRDLGFKADDKVMEQAIRKLHQNQRKKAKKEQDLKNLHTQQQQWRDQSQRAATSCFPTATRILTPTGHREIGDIEPGDTVLSTNPSGQLVHATVTAKKSYGSSPITRIVLDNESRDLRTTAHHSFQTDTGWKQASQLQAGDTLLKVDDSGKSCLVRIEAITSEAPEPVFNLHTTGPHNFIAEGVLAHNFTELRWLRTWAHRLFVDPFHSGAVEGVEA